MDTETGEQLAEMRKEIDGRFTRLDQRVQALEIDVAVIKSNYATKADVLAAKNSIIMWIIGAVVFTQLLPTVIKALGG